MPFARRVLGGTLGSMTSLRLRAQVGCLSVLMAAAPNSDSQSLREPADRNGILVGAAVRPAQLTEPAYALALARDFNMVEPEDAMKWWVVRPDSTTFDFSQGDRVVAFARTHAMKVRGHTLVWGHSNPGWLTKQPRTALEMSALLEEHIRKVVTHYRGEVFAWDVVNEAFDEHGMLRSSPWYDQPGIGLAGKSTAYLEQAFRWAHEADPDALLFYNDAEGEGMNAKSDAVYTMVKDFRRRGVPIDGVGLQMHIFDLKSDVAGIDANIARLTGLGIQVHITELDVAIPTGADGRPRDAADLNRQAEIYLEIALTCLRHKGCSAIQTWGFTDKYSWIRSATRGAKGNALLLDEHYGRKSAWFALEEALGSRSPQAEREPAH